MTPDARWRRVGSVLAFGAVYDLAFGVAILGFTRPAASILGLQVPSDPVYLYLCGVLLLLLAAIYAVASRDPKRYRAIAPISSGGRGLGFGLFVWAWATGRPAAFVVLGCSDLAIALATLALWQRAVRLSD